MTAFGTPTWTVIGVLFVASLALLVIDRYIGKRRKK